MIQKATRSGKVPVFLQVCVVVGRFPCVSERVSYLLSIEESAFVALLLSTDTFL